MTIKTRVWVVKIENDEGGEVARRYFETYEAAEASYNNLLAFTWRGYLAAPAISSIEVDKDAAADLLGR